MTRADEVPVVIVGLGMTGLGVVRSLAPCGMPLIAIDSLPRKASARTRLCRKILVDPREGRSAWDAVLEVGREHPVRPVLIPTSDAAVLEASRRRAELEPLYRFRLPAPEQVETLMDKTAFAAFAEREGLPVPRTFAIHAGRGSEGVLAGCRFPCLVKPKYRSAAWVAAGLTKVFRAESADDLRRLLERLGSVEDDFVVQEWIPGTDEDVFFHLTYWDGSSTPRVAFTGHKLRQWPPLLGSTTLAEAAESDEVDTLSRRLLARVGFHGLGSVEFKRDARDGRFKITEVTVGRPNLQSEVATANGVNIVHEAYCELTGRAPAEHRTARRNARWIFVDNDLSSALYYWRRGELTLGRFLRSWRAPRYYADLSWSDPLPFLAQVARVLRGALGRLGGSRLTAGPGRQLN